MIHYHGTPISPRAVLDTLAGRNFCVSFARPDDVAVCHRIGQSVMLDNGAYSAWRSDRGERERRGATTDWEAWAAWVQEWLVYPTTWAVLPDVIDGSEEENDYLAATYAWVTDASAPVWHLHESLGRLEKLCATYGRVCFGSSGAYAELGTDRWHRRVSEAFDRIAAPSGRVPWIHMLRGMAFAGDYPFGSVDSTDIGRNHNRPQNTARAMADRWDAINPAPLWKQLGRQLDLEGAA